ncbi:MAG: hypothetical protein ABWK00_05525 [Desulfurococcaceae archaeon]
MGLSRAYLAGSVVAVALFYLVPYLFLGKSRGPELIAFWSSLVLLWIVVTVLYMRRST